MKNDMTFWSNDEKLSTCVWYKIILLMHVRESLYIYK